MMANACMACVGRTVPLPSFCRLTACATALLLVTVTLGCAKTSGPHVGLRDQWVDADTGHKITRLSRREGNNECFYFHQNPFTASGDKLVFMGSTEKERCAFTVDLDTLEVRQVTFDRNVGFEVVAPKRREVFYLSGETVYATHLDTLATREVAKVPAHYGHGRGFSINADETLLAGCYAKGEEEFVSKMPRDQWIRKIFEAKLPNALYTINIATGEVHEFYHENEWLGHVQFSPTDPGLIEFCHEGPERELDRMWLIRTDGSGLRKLYGKHYPTEFVTHEFWSPDGKGVWFDLQVPPFLVRTLPFLAKVLTWPKYLAYTDLESGKTTQYKLRERYYSWHYNVSDDGKLFCGDGEGRGFRLCPSGKWIFLYRLEGGKLRVERLCSMKGHSYTIAPNAHFTPDGKSVVFQADMGGSTQVYAVEVK